MRSLGKEIAHARNRNGLTQVKLAARAKLSLATLQNLEAGKGNPELATLERLCEALGLSLQLQWKEPDWDRLASLGVPLLHSGKFHFRPDRHVLGEELRKLHPDILEKLGPDHRERGALVAWLRAIHDHFPTFWNENAPHLTQWLLEQKSATAEIKLRRIALSTLGQFL